MSGDILIQVSLSTHIPRAMLSVAEYCPGRQPQTIMAAVEAVGGKNGAAPDAMDFNGNSLQDVKREGDLKTPLGIYPVMGAFGYAPLLTPALPGKKYQLITKNSYWVDDPGSPLYNTYLESGEKPVVSSETMLRPDGLYEYGLIIGYNTANPQPGAGSAIFMHIWRGPNHGTEGCVALSRENMARLLHLYLYRPEKMWIEISPEK